MAIDRASAGVYTTGPYPFPQENNPCLDRVNMCQTRQRALLTSTPSPSRPWWRTSGTTITPPAPDVAIWPSATNAASARYMTWAICPPDVRLISW